MTAASEARRLVAEFLGTALLLVAVVGSGITTSVDGAASSKLFQHAAVVGVALVALIAMFGPVSGAHFNPAVTAIDWWFKGLPGARAARYIGVQIVGAFAGAVLTHVSFGLPPVVWATQPRDGIGLAVGEAIATAGLLLVIFGLVRTGRAAAVPGAVGAWIAAAIYFTPSASFANPAVTLARAVTDTYTGIAPASVPGFVAGQAAGTLAAAGLIGWLYAPAPEDAGRVVVPVADDAADRSRPAHRGRN